ncbi:ADP-ribosylation factor-like protein 6 [Drosophila tropicalis]|uniref:ADP-ribosylation factor-like protein 6 n=1 Tax=Drosophila tropicalis TaxID=46794 RepID=UPI0035AB6CF9
MGQRCFSCCCCCCSSSWDSSTTTSLPQTVTANTLSAQPKQFKVLILGQAQSGKTQLGHLLSGSKRQAQDTEPTNGVRCYRMEMPAIGQAPHPVNLSLTEIGGNEEMQRIWPHYYASAHGLIFCFDLSLDIDDLQLTFDRLAKCLQGTALSGKPVLLVARQERDGVQLYDIEHTFHLEHLAKSCNCPLHICHMDNEQDRWRGIIWLQRQLLSQASSLEQRIKYDMNMESWQRRKRSILSSGKLAQVHRHRFRRQHRRLWPIPTVDSNHQQHYRPGTAPASVSVYIIEEARDHLEQKQEPQELAAQVP